MNHPIVLGIFLYGTNLISRAGRKKQQQRDRPAFRTGLSAARGSTPGMKDAGKINRMLYTEKSCILV
jgi:hypothetical protein